MNIVEKLRDLKEYLVVKRGVEKVYKSKFGRSINWKHPTRFTEKVQIFKISKKAEKLWKYVDKYKVRSYIEKQIGKEYVTRLFGVYTSPDEIDFEKLPSSFALKTTHGSGWNILCPDKSKLDKEEAKKKLTSWLKENYYYSYGNERQYKLIPPRIICEEYLETPDKGLYDFKFYCFHGEPRFINVICDRAGETKKAFYELPWKKSELQPWSAKGDLDTPRPENLDKMIELARKLSEPFDQVRVDLYDIRGRILFGELTFSCSSGIKRFVPDRFDTEFGSYW